MNIITLGDDVLRQKAIPVPEINGEVIDFANEMIKTMIEGNGIGLAAPQVGDLRRIFVCQLPEEDPLVFINPDILETSMETEPYEEGCLSIPTMYANVVRPSIIKVQAWNLKGRPFTLDADDLLARVIQHEMDHLNGVLFIDHLNKKQRERLIQMYNRKMRVK